MTGSGTDTPTFVFDVLGTVIDERGSTVEETEAQFAAAGLEPARAREVAQGWLDRSDATIADIAAPSHPWAPNDALRRQSLLDTLSSREQALLGAERLDRLSTIGHRPRPWPDSVAALDRIARRATVVALTNGDLRQSVRMSQTADLRWHCLLTGDLVEAFKPDSRMYELPLQRLGLPGQPTWFVAAHPWDLRGARGHGYRTVYVARPDEATQSDAEFDLRVEGLTALADRLENADS